MNEYISMWQRGLDFSGTANRKEFWMPVLVNFIIGIILGAVTVATGLVFISWIYSIAILIPGLAIGVRRLRDAGFSPFLYFLVFIPFVGGIILIVLWCCDSKY